MITPGIAHKVRQAIEQALRAEGLDMCKVSHLALTNVPVKIMPEPEIKQCLDGHEYASQWIYEDGIGSFGLMAIGYPPTDQPTQEEYEASRNLDFPEAPEPKEDDLPF
jgi:hypothetical protein